jgi:hypothetical protein
MKSVRVKQGFKVEVNTLRSQCTEKNSRAKCSHSLMWKKISMKSKPLPFIEESIDKACYTKSR